MQAEALVHDYLGRLQAASWPLQAARREELRSEVAEHIEAALAEAGRRDEITVLNVLERLGAPEEIVAAEGVGVPGATRDGPGWGGTIAASGATGATSLVGPVEIAGLLLLAIGGAMIPFVGWVPGLAVVWLSGRWTIREKTAATVIVVAMIVVQLVLVFGFRFGLTA